LILRYQSISLILKRLDETFGKAVVDNIELNGIPKDMESAFALANKKDDRTRKEFEKWAVLTYSNNKALINEKKGADHGIDGIAYIMEGAEIFRDVLFSVKSGHSSLSHFRDFCHVVTRDKAAIGIYLTLDEPSKPMNTEATKMGKYINPLTEQEFNKVSIVTIKELLDGERLNIPTSVDVLKKADLKRNNNQSKLDF
jgi:site-specific DNA-methyltransferase (adenine-specific)